MSKLVIAMLATILIVVFAICNSHHVDVNFPVGKLEIRLIFLLSISFLIGMTVPVFHRLFRGMNEKKRKEREAELEQVIERINKDITS